MGLTISKLTYHTNAFSLPKTKLIVGLGNVGKKYQKNRHNIGFVMLDAFHKHIEAKDWAEKSKFNAVVAEKQIDDGKLVLAKPTTMMNLSGDAVAKLIKFYRVEDEDILLVYDDVDLPFGTIRTRIGGSAAGHNGVKSVAKTLGDDFARIRIGVANKQLEKLDTAEFVLKNFTKKEQEQFDQLKLHILSILDNWTTGEFDETSVSIT